MKASRFHRIVALAACGLLAGLAGCSSFEKDWSLATTATGKPNTVHGAWEGTWYSHNKAHSGGIRCLLSDVDGETLHAHFKSTFGPGLLLTHEHQMNLKRSDKASEGAPKGAVSFRGGEHLADQKEGARDYTYEGWVTPERFYMRFKSVIYTGYFEMTRP